MFHLLKVQLKKAQNYLTMKHAITHLRPQYVEWLKPMHVGHGSFLYRSLPLVVSLQSCMFSWLHVTAFNLCINGQMRCSIVGCFSHRDQFQSYIERIVSNQGNRTVSDARRLYVARASAGCCMSIERFSGTSLKGLETGMKNLCRRFDQDSLVFFRVKN